MSDRPTRGRPIAAPLLFTQLLTILAVLGCGVGRSEKTPSEPPQGRWRLLEIDGRIRQQSGGTPVLCFQGETEHLPLPILDPTAPADSWVELGPESQFFFSFAFETDEDYEIMTNQRGSRSAAIRSRSPGSRQESVSVAGSWSWPERTAEGSVESGLEEDERLRGVPRRAFHLLGNFQDPTHLAGTWSYEEVSELAGCWSRSVGRGAWTATPAE